MANNRIFYACQAVVIGPVGQTTVYSTTPYASSTALNFAKGLQSVGVNTTFNLEQAFEIGQISIYENIEEVPDVDVTIEKVIDGFPLLYHLATPLASAVGETLVARSAVKCALRLGIWPATGTSAADGSAPSTEVYCSGMFLSNVTFTIPVDGNCTESISLVGNDKRWYGGGDADAKIKDNDGGFADESPLALIMASGGVQRRENIDFGRSIMPTSLDGIQASESGNNSAGASHPYIAEGDPIVHIQSITVSADLGREPIQELGRKAPYFRYATFPVEVSCDIETISTSGDFVQAFEEGDPANAGTVNQGNNTPEETIHVSLNDSTFLDLGSKNRLGSVTFGGGDAGGGNATATFSYTNFNDLSVRHRNDPHKANAGYNLIQPYV